MADLDDFFAKKDRKKSKGKKFATADEIAKKLEESGKKIEKSKKDKVSNTGPDGEESTIRIQEEDEWKEFEEEKKDYTGLKIQNLTLVEGEIGDESLTDNENRTDREMEENEAGELVPKRKVQAGPWKVVAQPQTSEDEAKSKPVEKKQEETISSKPTSGSYVPPHVRNLTQPAYNHPGRLAKSKAAPDVNNEELFPTLSAGKNAEPATGAWGRKKRDDAVGFEEVRNSKSHSSRYLDSTKMPQNKLSLGNKYGALTQDQS